MGKKTLKTDEYNFDADLDFDFGDFDDDASLSKESKNSKPRSPVTEVAKGVVSGAKNKLVEPAFIRRVAEKALPRTYGEIFDKADKVTGAAAALYDDAVKEVKPTIGRFAAKLDKLVPEENKRLKKVTSWLHDKVGESGSSRDGQSKEQMEDESIAQSLNSVFSQQADLNAGAEARANARADIRDNIEHKKFRSTIGALTAINQSASRLAQYTEKVTQPYQKKSLELQFRSYFLQREQFKLSEQMFEVFKAQNESIVKNTALPEFVKITDHELWKQHTKNRIIEKGMSMFGGSKMVNKIKDRIKDRVNQKVRSVKDAFQAGIEGIEGIEGLQEQNQMLAEAGMEGQSNANMAGNMIGGGIMESMVNTFGKFLKTNVVDKNTKAVKFGNKAAAKAGNLTGWLAGLGNNKELRNMEYEGGPKGKVAEIIRNLSTIFQDNPDTLIEKNDTMGGMSAPATFTNKFMLTVNDVIPGYLARINQGITMLVTGDKSSELLLYDFKRSEFKSTSTMRSELSSRLKKTVKDSSVDRETNKAHEKLFGKDNGHTDEQKKKVKGFMYDVSQRQMDYTAENIRETEEYQNLDPKTRKIIDKMLSKSEEDSDDGTGLKYDLSKALVSVRESIPGLYGELKEMIQQGYGDTLVEEGIIKKKQNGEYEIDETKALAFIKEHSIGISDIHAKKGIKPVNPQNALKAIRKTPVKQWTYKQGKGDEGEHIGPMAQTVNQNFGEDAAPGKKGIDLISLNGATMSAIQALDEKIDNSDLGTANSTLLLIRKDTAALVNLGRQSVKMLAKGGRGRGKVSDQLGEEGVGGHDGSYTGMIGSLIGTTVSLAGKMTKGFLGGAGTVLGGVGKGAKWLGNGMKSIFEKNKDRLKNTFTGLFDGALKFSKKVFDFTSDMLFKKLPAGWNFAAKKLTAAKDWIVNKFKELTDVYVKGRAEPALRATLLKMDYYKDSITGKYIHTLEDLQSLKGNIVDNAGNVVLTVKEMADGVFNNRGQEIKSLANKLKDKVIDGLKGGWDRLKSSAKGIKDFFTSDKMKERKDNIVNRIKGTTFPNFEIATTNTYRILFDIRRIIAQKFRIKVNNDGLKDPVSTKIAASASKLKDVVTDKLKGFKLPSFQGLKDKFKNKFNAWKEGRAYQKSDDFMGPVKPGMLDKATGLYDTVTDKLSSAKDSFNEKKQELIDRHEYQNSDEFMGPQQPSAKDRISGAASSMSEKAKEYMDRFKANRSPDFVGPKPRGKLGLLKSVVGGVFSKKDKPNPDEFVGPQPQSLKDKASGFVDKIKNAAKDRKAAKEHESSDEFVGPKPEGMAAKAKRKVGDWRERLNKESENEKKRDKGFVKADETPRYMNAAGGVLDLIKNGLGSAFDKISGFFDFAEGWLSKSKIFGALKAGWNVAKGLGRGAMTVGRMAVTAAKYVRPALAVMSAVSGGAGAAIAAGATAAISGVLAVVGSPVILAAAAVAVTGYVGYKLIKKNNQNKVDDFAKIRARQYGLRFDGTDDAHASEITQLENYLLEKSVGYSNGQAYLIDTNVKSEEMLGIMRIDKKDDKAVGNFITWFQKRFKPFFLTHLTALYGIDNKKTLYQIRDLEPAQQIEFLNSVSFESGPYNEDTSPFKDVDGLEVNNEPVQNAIKILTEEIKKGVKKDDKKVTADAAKAKSIEDKMKAAQNTAGAISVTGRDFKPADAAPPSSVSGPSGGDLVGKASADPNAIGQGTGDGAKPQPKPVPGSAAPASSEGSSATSTKSAPGPMVDGSMAKQYIKNAGANFNGINPAMLKNFYGMIQEYGEKTGKKVVVSSGFRSSEQQAKLFKEKPGLAAPPGRSMHEKGLAIDADGKDLDAVEKEGLMAKYGFTRPVGGEPWHIEPIGIQGNYAKARSDPNLAAQMTDAGLGKGGGGIGAKPGSKKGDRNSVNAVKQLGIKVKDDTVAVTKPAVVETPVKAADTQPNPAIQQSIKKSETETEGVKVEEAKSNGTKPDDKALPPKPNAKPTPGSVFANSMSSGSAQPVTNTDVAAKPAVVAPSTAVKQATVDIPKPPVVETRQPSKPIPTPQAAAIPASVIRGNSDAMTNSDKSLGTISETLSKSLTVQETMVSLLQSLVSNLSPQAFADLLTKVSPQPVAATPGPVRNNQTANPETAIDFKRKKF